MSFRNLHSSHPIEWLLAILLIIAPLYSHPNMGGVGLHIPHNIIIWTVASAISFYSLYKLATSQFLFLPRYFLLLLAFPIFAFFSGSLSGVEIAGQWVFRMLFIWGGVLFFFGLFQHKLKQGRIDRLLFMITISGILHALVGFSQIIWVKHIPPWLPPIPINPTGLPTGLFQQINNHASFQVTSIIIALWLASRPIITKGSNWRFIIILTAIACGGFIVSYSGSRIGALSFLLAFPLILISRWPMIKRESGRWLLIIFVLFTSIISAAVIENTRGLTGALEKTAALNSGFSGSARLGIYSITLDLIEEKPIFGHGIGSFVRVWQLKKPEFYAAHPDATLPPVRVTHPHNEIIFWLVEGGLITGVGLLCVLISIFLTLKQLPHSRRYAYAALLTPILLHTQVELPFYTSASHWFIFLFILFVVMRANQRQYRVILSYSAVNLIKIISIIGSLAALSFLAHSMAASYEFKRYIQQKTSTEELLPTAIQNPFFRELATEAIMTSLLQHSIQSNIDDNVKLFAEWGSEEVKYNPHILFYRLTVHAYIHLKQEQDACTIADEGNAIYPTNDFLSKVVEHCSKQPIL